MFTTKKTLLIAGVGALAYYLYSRMDKEQKDNIVKTVKDQLGKTMERFMPRNSKASFETRMDNVSGGELGQSM